MENIKSETTGQKRIDTIATDIKTLVAGISNGKPANVTEENMDKFLKNIKEAFNSWNNPVREKDGKLRMSVLGKPPRQLWYDRFSPKKTKSYDASLNIKFLYGHILEHLLLYLAELTGHKIGDQQKKVEIDNIKGHIDATVDGEVCDVTIWNGNIIQVDPPKFVNLTVLSTEDTIKGDTVSSTLKNAKLENGEIVKVPIFIKEGEQIRVDTSTNEYASRVKN